MTLDTHCLRNPALKWDAKGLHSYLMQLPDDWKINIADLEKRSETGRDGTRAALNSLLEAGYLFRERKQGVGGKFEGYDYHLFERPEHAANWLAVNGKSVNGFADDGLTVNGKSDNNKYYSPTDLPINEKTNYEEEKAASLFSSSSENENPTLKSEKKENGLQSGAGAVESPLDPPFTPAGTIEPQPATIVRMYTPEHPDISLVTSVPGEYETKRGKKPTRYEPNIHPENEEVFAHFTEPELAKTAWSEWLNYKWREHRQKYKTAETERIALQKLWKTMKGDSKRVSSAIEHSEANQYKGIFEPKEQNRNNGQLNKAQQQHANLANYLLERKQRAIERGDFSAMG